MYSQCKWINVSAKRQGWVMISRASLENNLKVVALGDVESQEIPSVFLICLRQGTETGSFEVSMPSGITSVEHLFLQLWKMRPREGQTVSQAIHSGLLPQACPASSWHTASNSYKRDHVSENGPPSQSLLLQNSEKADRKWVWSTFFFSELWKLAKVLQ